MIEFVLSIFQTFFVIPITNSLMFFYFLFASLNVPFALSFAIIALTVAIRLVLYPLTAAQIKSSKKMQELAPKIKQIRARYKSDKQKQQKQIMQLYRDSGINPASGCLPMIIQIPVIWSLYSVLITIFQESAEAAVTRINELVYAPFLRVEGSWNATLFGAPLAIVPREVFTEQPLYVLVPLITALLQFLLSKMMTSNIQSSGDDFQSAFQKQLVFVFPLMIGWFSFVFPLGLSLYWNTFTLFGILQQYKLSGWGGLESYVAKIKK